MSGGRGRTIRRDCLELWPGLVLHGIGKFTFQHLTVNWLPKNLAFSAIYWAFSAIPIYWECTGILGYSDLLGMGVLGYSDLLGLGLGVSDEWLLDLLVERPWAPWGPGPHGWAPAGGSVFLASKNDAMT